MTFQYILVLEECQEKALEIFGGDLEKACLRLNPIWAGIRRVLTKMGERRISLRRGKNHEGS
jgi:hypothetical protein